MHGVIFHVKGLAKTFAWNLAVWCIVEWHDYVAAARENGLFVLDGQVPTCPGAFLLRSEFSLFLVYVRFVRCDISYKVRR